MLHTDNPHEFMPPEIHLGVAGWTIRREHADKIWSWCIFDNTALGAATADAFVVRSQLSVNQRAGR